MTLLESFTVVDWLFVVFGCLLIILIPSLVFAGIITVAGRFIGFLRRRGEPVREHRP